MSGEEREESRSSSGEALAEPRIETPGGDPRVADVRERLASAYAASAAPSEKAKAKLDSQNKLFVRDRIALLFDEGSFVEDGRYANATAEGLPADGVVTGRGTVDGRAAIVIANDPSVKAGSWGSRTVEKIVRATEMALREELPVFWFVDSAGARITDQVEMFPGRRGAGRIFHNQVALSGKVPQICCLFGPSAAGGAYIPSFTDLIIMVEGNASMYLGSPRMAEMVVGEKVTLEEMGGARMHCTVSGVGDLLAEDDTEAIELAKLFFSYLPGTWHDETPTYVSEEPAAPLTSATVPEKESQPFDVHDVIDGLVDDDSFFEIKPLFAAELVVGFGRMEGRTVGIVANNSMVKGGVLFTDSADKAARFIWMCDAYSVPILYLADVPGFMIGSEVERGGIIRHGAKMVSAVSEATVPQFCIVLRKAYGAGLYAMGGPGFGPDATLALPTARIAVMGPEAAVNAVYANKIAAIEDEAEREAFVQRMREEYLEDVDLERLAADLVVDGIIEADELRGELLHRLRYAARRDRLFSTRRRSIPPV
ncbi:MULTISPECIES: acyl-CoA carboxylase subunit beta [Barrientosiimonas]|uniref:Propionyl-CoA carboxylase subunit beta n=1 Tax=Barrientosiimonas endolithica TaxID=1535208 RepID=A0ABN6YNK5_9MICO|nr:acyl-CoA carboxylase subunit beta [Barrientosiimonas endolithica]BDZ58945.1 propionyl-CoA carboxylase subunit beta [Barrientosiimonas endolithica]